MPMPGEQSTADEAKAGALQYVRAWGESSVPPTALATLITAQNLRPLAKVPMLFPPILLFASYLNLSGYPTDAAGITSAWSAAYFVVARRRSQNVWGKQGKFSPRGMIRGATLGVCAVNVVCGGWAYFRGRKEDEEE
ncbi:hypothetical protein AAFC00_003663 [Neodothiora populina]|uniref:Altered inheritance of mitochondria protein 19 n=1 Tax=Neodothiora populina TaxID=2781224 RepID=A0ABR3PF47_9PEZI